MLYMIIVFECKFCVVDEDLTRMENYSGGEFKS